MAPYSVLLSELGERIQTDISNLFTFKDIDAVYLSIMVLWSLYIGFLVRRGVYFAYEDYHFRFR